MYWKPQIIIQKLSKDTAEIETFHQNSPQILHLDRYQTILVNLKVPSSKMAVLEVVPGTDVYLWKYIPSLPGNVVFAALWTIMAALVGYRMFKTKTWFVSAFFVGLICKS